MKRSKRLQLLLFIQSVLHELLKAILLMSSCYFSCLVVLPTGFLHTGTGFSFQSKVLEELNDKHEHTALSPNTKLLFGYGVIGCPAKYLQ